MHFVDDYIFFEHSGTPQNFDYDPHGSGRYRQGEGENPHQHELYFNQYVRQRKNAGESEIDIAKDLGMSVAELRSKVSISKAEKTASDRAKALKLKDKGYSNKAIAEKLDVSEGTIRNLLNPALEKRTETIDNIASTIKKNVDKKGYIDVGPGVEIECGISRTKMNAAIQKLKDEGYEKIVVQQEQMGFMNNQKTYITVMCPPGTTYKDVVTHREKISTMEDYFVDNGRSCLGLKKPQDVSSDRVMIRYNEQGGVDKDGVIELRPGVADLDLGKSKYAQVRISVDGTHYLKGMAMYCADPDKEMPKGVDIIFNTNKHLGTDKMDVLKKQKINPLTGKIDEDNPFGSNIKPGGQKGALNICREEGDWDLWSDKVASQVLSKQPTGLAKQQINLSLARKKQEFEEISQYTNPVIKRKLLSDFAESCDSDAVSLHAAAFPRQAWKVILPVQSLKDNEIYAPTFRDGERVVLVRYPHGGIFEIPELTVNNNHRTAKKVLGNSTDAVGINSHVAERLSGADFDGDTVLVIPTRNVKIRTSSQLPGLKNFDPKELYQLPDDAPKMKSQTKQTEMGKVSNLITDMTIKGAKPDELARAVRHSMVIIDAEKHHLDYKQSFKDNDIKALKKKYQDNGDGKTGASTLISRAGSEVHAPELKRSYRPNPKTGEWEYTETGRTYKVRNKKTGELEEKLATKEYTRMFLTKDARKLSSGTDMEDLYADYANSLKAMANQARKEMMATKNIEYSPSARKTYAKEVEVLEAKLMVAKKNAPRERQAQNLAGIIYKSKLEEDPSIKDDKEKLKKIRNQALADARDKMGVKKVPVEITDREWEAIQNGAITNNMLTEIINNTNADKLKQRAMPKQTRNFTNTQVSTMKAMQNAGYTIAEIADKFGVSSSTISNYINK